MKEQFNKMNWSQNDIKKLFSKINYPGNNVDCWLWVAGKDRNGYGDFRINKTYRAHRLVYEYYFGQIPLNMMVCHKCDNPSCCNPDHLFLGNHKINMADMKNKGRSAKGSKQGTSKFTEKDIADIILDGYNYKYSSMSEIANKYSVSVTIISNILEGKFWSHITEPLLQLLKISKKDLCQRIKKFELK